MYTIKRDSTQYMITLQCVVRIKCVKYIDVYLFFLFLECADNCLTCSTPDHCSLCNNQTYERLGKCEGQLESS